VLVLGSFIFVVFAGGVLDVICIRRGHGRWLAVSSLAAKAVVIVYTFNLPSTSDLEAQSFWLYLSFLPAATLGLLAMDVVLLAVVGNRYTREKTRAE